MSPEEKPINDARGYETRHPRTEADGFEVGSASRWGAIYPFVTLAQTLAAALLIAALVVNGTTPSGDAAIVEAATRLALAIVFVAVYVPATATLLRWYAESREARRLLSEAQQDVEAILRTRRS